MARGRDCDACDYFSRRPEYGHPDCFIHRPCITRGGYEPTLCEYCNFNRGAWDHFSPELAGWRRVLDRHAERVGGPEPWLFAATFTQFFEVVLPTADEDNGSRSRGRTPQQGRGSLSGSPFARNNTQVSPSTFHDSRSPRSSRRDGRGSATGPRPGPSRSSPRSSHRDRRDSATGPRPRPSRSSPRSSRRDGRDSATDPRPGPSRSSPHRYRSRSGGSEERRDRSRSPRGRSASASHPAGTSGDPLFTENLAGLQAQINRLASLLRDSTQPRGSRASRSASPTGGSPLGHPRARRRHRARVIDSSESDDGAADSDDSSHAAGGHSPVRTDSHTDRKPAKSITELKVHSFTGSYTYFNFTPDLEYEDGRGILLDGIWHPYTRHPTAAAFRLNVTAVTRDVLISPAAATEAVKRAFTRLPLDRTKAGSAGRAIACSMEELPALQSLLSVLQDRDRALVKAVVDQEFPTFAKCFTDFKSLMGVIFTDQWKVCPSFEDFAKPEQISLVEDALILRASTTPFVPNRFLLRELEKRNKLVDLLSSLALLFRLAASLQGSDTPSSQLTLTAIRGILPSFQEVLFSWMSSKIDIRKIFLQGSKSPLAHSLIHSTPWVPSLFPFFTLLELTKSPCVQGKDIMRSLGWSSQRDSLLRDKQKDIDPRFPDLLPGSSGIKRRLQSPPGRRFGPSTSSSGASKRFKGTSLPRKDSRKPFRGVRGSRRGRKDSSSATKGSSSKQRKN